MSWWWNATAPWDLAATPLIDRVATLGTVAIVSIAVSFLLGVYVLTTAVRCSNQVIGKALACAWAAVLWFLPYVVGSIVVRAIERKLSDDGAVPIGDRFADGVGDASDLCWRWWTGAAEEAT